MADLTAIFHPLASGAPLQIQAELAGLWAVIGTGRLTGVSAHSLSLDGSIEAVDPGPFSLRLALESDGAAAVTWRDVTGTGGVWFDYDDGVVVTAILSGRAGELSLWPGGGGVYVALAGAVTARLWLGAG